MPRVLWIMPSRLVTRATRAIQPNQAPHGLFMITTPERATLALVGHEETA